MILESVDCIKGISNSHRLTLQVPWGTDSALHFLFVIKSEQLRCFDPVFSVVFPKSSKERVKKFFGHQVFDGSLRYDPKV